MMRMLIILSLLAITSCTGKSDSVPLFKAKKSLDFDGILNHKQMPKDPNLTLDKSIVNNDYPIEIALYEDQKFYYNLPNLGDGTGTWKYSDGIIELRAKRTLFDMYIEIYGANQEITKMAILFSDRFGAKTLAMENINF